jgi:excisionase family DNA binding protein
MSEPEKLLTPAQVRAVLGLSKNVVYALLAGPIPTVRLGRSIRVRPEALERWLREREGATEPWTRQRP